MTKDDARKKKRGRRRGVDLVAGALVFGVLAFALFSMGAFWLNRDEREAAPADDRRAPQPGRSVSSTTDRSGLPGERPDSSRDASDERGAEGAPPRGPRANAPSPLASRAPVEPVGALAPGARSTSLAPERGAGGAPLDSNAGVAPSDPRQVALRDAAAGVALTRGLVDPETLDRAVRQRVPDGSLPPEALAAAREDARRDILADAAIADELASAYDDPDKQRAARGWARTLLAHEGDALRERKLEDVTSAESQ